MSRAKPESCVGCPLHAKGTDFSVVTGTGSSSVLIVGEASGEHEARQQEPFVSFAPAGSLLERTIKRMSMDRAQFAITNVCRCHPPNDYLAGAPWEYAALSQCRPNLVAAIAQHRPKSILALGGTALRVLTGLAGEKLGVSHLRGYVLPTGSDLVGSDGAPIPVVPSFHPSFIRRGAANLQGVFARDMQRARNVAAGKDATWIWGLDPKDTPEWEASYEQDRTNTLQNWQAHGLRYQAHPSLDEAWGFYQRVRDNIGDVLCYDLETFESANLDEDARDGFADTSIRLVQFSLASGQGIAFPWEGAYRDAARAILSLPIVKCGHNVWLFDNKVLAAVSAREGVDYLPVGTVHDTLQMFHWWQPDLPAHLQFAASFVNFPFPWKHLAGTELELYGCADVDATLRLYGMLEATMRRDLLWGAWQSDHGYLGQVAEVRPVLAEMEARGVPIDDARRVALDGEFQKAQEELDGELQARFPDGCRAVTPRRGKAGNYSYGYMRAPAETDGLLLRSFDEPGVDNNGNPVMVSHARWCRLEPFLPNSAPQLIAYMKAKGHPVPKSLKKETASGEKTDTTAKKELQRLALKVKDDFYLKVIEYREFGKARSTYVDGFRPHVDGCVHTTFTFDTGIGQLSSRNPNVQNFPKHGRLAKPLRAMVAAPPGMMLSEWDFKSCHVLTLGFLSEDANYLRLARLDMHSFVTGHALKLWDGPTILRESDEELMARFKWLKANPEWRWVRDARVKHAILGIGNGLKAKGLYDKHPEDFGSQKVATQFLGVCEELFPKVFAWQKRMQQLAHDQQFLRTQYGAIRRFYEVFRWDSRKGGWAHGDQAEMAISFWLSNIAFGYIRGKLKRLRALGLAERYGLCNNVHDSFVFNFDARLREDHLREIQPVLVAPDPLLTHPTIAPEGLWIGVDCSIGQNWAEMEEQKLLKVVGGLVIGKEAAHEIPLSRPAVAGGGTAAAGDGRGTVVGVGGSAC